MNSELRSELLERCSQYVELRIARIDGAIKDLNAALKLETKCSMGDKYETGRAMLHLEFEKLSGQYLELQKLRKTLSRIPEQASPKIGFGSIVITSERNYFLSIPAGELEVQGRKFYAIGSNAPIANVLKGNGAGGKVIFNKTRLLIKEVL